MLFMNHSDIDAAVRKYRPESVSGRAAQILADLRDQANEHSDGWHSWPLPARAAAKLMAFVQGPEDAVTRSEANLRRALVPIKAFMTRRGLAAGMSMPILSRYDR